MRGRVVEASFTPAATSHAMAMFLLASSQSPKGLRRLKRAAKLAEKQAIRAKVANLRGPKLAHDAIQSMSDGAVMLQYLVQIAVEQRALAKLR